MENTNNKITKGEKIVDAKKSASKLLKSTLKIVPKRAHAATIDVPLRATAYGLDKSMSGLKLIKDDGSDVLDSVLKHATYSTFESHHGDKLSENDEDMMGDDLAKSRYMMKNVANLLTTASLYAGLDNAENVNELSSNLDSKTSLNENPKDRAELGAQTEDADVSKYKLTSRKPTLFELSVTPQRAIESTNEEDPEVKSHRSNVTKKLQERFDLKDNDNFIYDCTAWILKDVLIQGRIFLTTNHLLFYALLPKSSDGDVTMTGNLNVRSRLKGITRYWCILKGTILSLYTSPSNIYFPVLTIDLRNVNDIEHEEVEEGKVFTLTIKNKHKFRFIADSKNSASTWYKALTRQRFTANFASNNALKIVIPMANILYVDDETIVKEAVTLSVRVLETSGKYVMDDYVFMFLDQNGCELKESLINHLNQLKRTGVSILYDEDESDVPLTPRKLEQLDDSLVSLVSEESTHSSRFPHLKKLREKGHSWLHKKAHSLKNQNVEESLVIESTYNRKHGDEIGDSFLQDTSDAVMNVENNELEENNKKVKLVPWHVKSLKNMTEMWGAKPLHYPNKFYQFTDNIPLAHEDVAKEDNEKFREHFNLPESQCLISSYFAYLNRNVPTYGKLYIGNESMCFRSLLPGTNTIMILPHSDVQSCYIEKGVRLGYYILVIVIDSHNELFFEFSSESTRDDARKIISQMIQKGQVKLHEASLIEGKESKPITTFIESNPEHAKLKFFEDKISQTGIDIPLIFDHNPYYSTQIKPAKSYNIALLTIGSRGDVQPYIAFGRGLMKEGHKVTIITHSEFRGFVETHGIGFKEIAGNPAELMSLMVEHESMNIGMLRDASSKFSGWITDLLDTTWIACKDENFDILVESPSAMAGIHIAEALNIAYFRAFTMPWTRTRAYPHAFIVPDQKRGGNYNYLTHVLFENVFWKGICGQVNKWRVETLHLKKTNLDMMQQNKVPFFYNVSPTIFPPSVDFNEWVKVTGYWFLDEKSNYDPPEALVSFIKEAREKKKSLVYIGFGSIVVSNAKEMTKALVEAVLKADVYCVLNKGWSDRLGDASSKEVEVELPPCIFNAGTVPHDWLFPQMDASVHHGGSGTVGATMRCGLPTIVKPFFGDQFFYASQIEDIGVGISLKKFNVESLASALKEVTSNLKMKENAKMVQRQIAKENGVQTAINCIYSELEYARSLIADKHTKNKIAECHSNVALMGIEKITNMGLADVSGVVSSVVSSVNPIDTSLEDSWVLL